jgi:hypothetical protein
MAVAKLDLFDQVFTNDGDPGAGYKIYSYEGGTTTPLATYTDSTGLTANANPIVADSAGRFEVWITVDTAYKFALKTDGDVTLETVDNVRIDSGASAEASTVVRVEFFRPDTDISATDELFKTRFDQETNFSANWSGSMGVTPRVNPAASYAIAIQRNAVTVGTATFNTSGVCTFATSGGASFTFAAGDEIKFLGPSPVDANMADFGLVLIGELAA